MPQVAQPKINPPTGSTPQRRDATANAPQKHKQRITSTTAGLMIAAAALLDIISIIPVIGKFIATFGGNFIFLIWFLVLGIPLLSPKKIVTYCGAFILGILPFLSALPEITFAVVIIIIITRGEDTLGIQVLSRKGLTSPERLTGYIRSLASPEQLSSYIGGATKLPINETPSERAPSPQLLEGATPATPPEESPVVASQQEHFADPTASINTGATPTTQQKTADQQDEKATQYNAQKDSDGYHEPDPYGKDSYSLESNKPPRSVDSLPRQEPAQKDAPAPFPGKSPQFGRGDRRKIREAQLGKQEGSVVDINTRRRAPETSNEGLINKGATPRLKDDKAA